MVTKESQKVKVIFVYLKNDIGNSGKGDINNINLSSFTHWFLLSFVSW
jgi:hypothetical protein